ncbi:MAG: AAA family ATPase [Ruminococcus flavefaciens]|nr:AAA family ATPase [Ruminococcus flavefaciens]
MTDKNIGQKALDFVKEKALRTILHPLDNMVDEQLVDISSTIGSFIIRSVRGKFQRSISFTIGISYSDKWMEEALYGILYQYNNIKGSSRLEITNKAGLRDGSGMYYRLDDGTHNLKYRNYDILVNIQSDTTPSMTGRISPKRVYTIITYNLSPDFVKDFEKDMVAHRNSLLKIKLDSPVCNVYQDLHESDGYTYWEKVLTIPKRRLSTIYLPMETKRKIVDTINAFFASKDYYEKHGIAHNLKILLYGPPGTGKDSIAKMIASEWNRNIYYVTGGKDGRFIPNAIVDSDEDVNFPMMLISDIDKYPFLINEPKVDIEKEEGKEEKMKYKQSFGAMINALDGVLSTEGRIIVMTTNHIELFSETILRAGRIDLALEIGYVTPEVMRRYVWDFYQVQLPKDIELKKEKITVADMQADVVFYKLTADEFIKKYVK